MRILGNILAGILSVVYFFVLFAMMILVFVSNIFSANYYKDILNDNALAEIKLTDFKVTALIEEYGEEASLEDVLIQSLEEAGVSKNDAIKIVNSEKINEVAGSFISDTMNYLVSNEEIPQLNYQDVKEIIESKEVDSVLENTLSDEEIKQLVDELNRFIAESFEGGI